MSVSSVKEPRKNKNKNEGKVEGERHWQFSLSGKNDRRFQFIPLYAACFDFSPSRTITISVD